MTTGPLHPLPADALARFGLTLIRRHRTTTDLKLPRDVAAYVRHNVLAGRHDGPLMGALFVDAELKPVGYGLPYLGYLSGAEVVPRDLLRPSLFPGIAALFLFQQRPAARLEADPYDVAVSERLRDAAEIVGVRLLDHLLVTPEGKWLSLRLAGNLVQLHDLGERVVLPYLSAAAPQIDRRRRVKPKYVNPADPSQTWSGRGRKPRWMEDALAAGARLEDFLIDGEQ